MKTFMLILSFTLLFSSVLACDTCKKYPSSYPPVIYSNKVLNHHLDIENKQLYTPYPPNLKIYGSVFGGKFYDSNDNFVSCVDIYLSTTQENNGLFATGFNKYAC